MKFSTFVLAAIFATALAGCASPRSFSPGASLEEVLARAGPPTNIRFDRNSDELWEYAGGPMGYETYLVRAGPDGKLKEVVQLLTEDQLNRIVPGKMTKSDVRDLLGEPSIVSFTAVGTVWSWNFRRDGAQPGWLTVRFNPDNTVFERIVVIEPTGGKGSRGGM